MQMEAVLVHFHLPVDYDIWISDLSTRRCLAYLWMASVFSFSTGATAVCSTIAFANDLIIGSTTSAILNRW